jgi:ribosomal-protein-alanine N-acetyltransferase
MIRALTKTDIDAVATLSLSTFSDGWNADMINGSFSQNGFLGLVYEVDNKIVSAITATYLFDEAEVLFIVTDKNYQRRGYADTLLKTALSELFGRGVKSVFLEVRQSNVGAIKLYSSNGFTKIAEREKYYGDETAIIMKALFLGL